MKIVPLELITVPANRQRRDFDESKLQELATSISTVGLLHALVVRPTDAGKWALVAGERRLRALGQLAFLGKAVRFNGEALPSNSAPIVSLGELDEIAAMEAELDENIRRTDLTWQERAQAVSQLAALRGKQAAAAGREPPKVAEIAREVYPQTADVPGADLGWRREAVRRDLIVAQHLDKPEIKAAKTVDEAFKILKRQEEVKKNVQLAATVGATFTADLHQAHNVDCLQWMAGASDAQFDVILTDPPYGMGAHKFGDSGGMVPAGAHLYDDSYENWQKLMPEFSRAAFRLAKPMAHLYVFCDFDRFHELKGYLETDGWQVFRTPLVWVKPQGSRLPWVDFGPQRKYELCLYANKGRKPVTHIFPDVVSYQADDNVGHNAQKPVALYVDLLKRSVAPGSKVLDPFAGSGTIFPACHELKCEAIGVEIDPAAYGLCLKRLEALKAQGELVFDTKSLLKELK